MSIATLSNGHPFTKSFTVQCVTTAGQGRLSATAGTSPVITESIIFASDQPCIDAHNRGRRGSLMGESAEDLAKEER
ncbi:hypothetical protein HPB52_011549 [Rhipicephalus sanguineus]|uniref:Uncharacterized protein n=1 Tax=Rhipicephalus sanguineus TaxID=34632 RepID=A0A9D4PZD6_RHISA|nr:hypothetical protein HPB52_011549 [Rhipicephalus sanguineus]